MGRAGGAGGSHSGGGHSFGGGHSGGGRSTFGGGRGSSTIGGRSSFGGGSGGSTTGVRNTFSGGRSSVGGGSSGNFGSATNGSSYNNQFRSSSSGGNSFTHVSVDYDDYDESTNNTVNCSENENYPVPYKPEVVFAALKNVVRQINGFNVENISDSEMSIAIDVGFSFKSNGENIYISVLSSSDHDSMLSIISESKSAVIDWGKNAENLNTIVDALHKELINFKAVHNESASTGNRSMISILCGSFLFLFVCILVTFKSMDYETPFFIYAGIILMISVILWNNLRDIK